MRILIIFVFFPILSFGQKIGSLPTSSLVDDSTYFVGQESTLGIFGLAQKIPFWQIKAANPSSNSFVAKLPLVKISGGSNPDTISDNGQSLKRTIQIGGKSDTGVSFGKSTGLNPYNQFNLFISPNGRATLSMSDTSAFVAGSLKLYFRPDSIFGFFREVTLPTMKGWGLSPSISFDATAGTTSLDSVHGTDGWGWFSIEAGTGMSTGTNPFLYISFPVIKTENPSYVVISPKNDAAAAIWNYTKSMMYCSGFTTSSATISITDTSPMTPGTHYSYYYDIRGYK